MYNKVYIYPAIITKLAENDYNIEFPDFNYIMTYGESIEDAYIMAEDALKLELFDLYTDNLNIPEPSNLYNFKVNKNQYIILVRVNFYDLIKEKDNKSVKKTLSIPSWLNKMAEKENINFSQVLQESLKNILKIQ